MFRMELVESRYLFHLLYDFVIVRELLRQVSFDGD